MTKDLIIKRTYLPVFWVQQGEDTSICSELQDYLQSHNLMNMDYKITTKVENEDGEELFRATSNSVEGGVQELYRFERHVLPTLDDHDCHNTEAGEGHCEHPSHQKI